MNIKNILKAAWSGGIIAPIALVVIQFLAIQLHLADFGVLITLYKHKPLAISQVIQWLLLTSQEALKGTNLVAVMLSWIIAWIIVADWTKSIDDSLIGLLMTYIVYILYLSWYRRIPVILYFPESFYSVLAASIATIIIVHIEKRRRRLSFFERLEIANIRIPPQYKIDIDLPIKCPSCGAVIYSNPRYCWKCGADLEREVYIRLVEGA